MAELRHLIISFIEVFIHTMLMANSSKHPIGIIGGGLGGLAAACTLAGRGHRVALFEKNRNFKSSAVMCPRARAWFYIWD